MFLSWWYGEEFAKLFRFIEKFFLYLYDLFSVEICLKTLFAVWRRDQIDYRDLPLPEILQAMSLNFVSRFVGFFVKIFTLAAYLVTTLLFVAAGIFTLMLWLFFPAIILGAIVFGIKISQGF